MTRSAYEWGLSRKPKPSCREALEWRKSLGSEATQADSWLACRRGDWLLWQLRYGLTREQYELVRPAIHRALEAIVKRAIRRGIKSLRGVRALWAIQWRKWASRWLSGEDRSVTLAWAAAEAVRAAAVWAAAARAAAEASRAAAWAAADVDVDVDTDAAAAARAAAVWAAAARAAEARAAADAVWAAAARAAAEAAEAWEAEAASEVARATKHERMLQARDIHREIPVWIWEV